MIIAFCVFSLVGHWMEIPYCLFNDWAFGIVDPDTQVFADPFIPFPVYGFAAVGCSLALVPLRDWMRATQPPLARAVITFFLLATLAAMAGELIQGFLQNQPDPITGEYPLWDNSQLPGNILGQAWIVNDLLLGAVITLYVWILYPLLVKAISFVPEKWGWPVTILVAVVFLILCVHKF